MLAERREEIAAIERVLAMLEAPAAENGAPRRRGGRKTMGQELHAPTQRDRILAYLADGKVRTGGQIVAALDPEPYGSVISKLSQLASSGQVVRVDRGQYQLGTPPAAPVGRKAGGRRFTTEELRALSVLEIDDPVTPADLAAILPGWDTAQVARVLAGLATLGVVERQGQKFVRVR
jgi:hypothetical protein